jgi:hypothetical protein
MVEKWEVGKPYPFGVRALEWETQKPGLPRFARNDD